MATKGYKLRQKLFSSMHFEDKHKDDLPDGAWQAMLEAVVVEFNEDENTDFDPHTMFLEYVRDQKQLRDKKDERQDI